MHFSFMLFYAKCRCKLTSVIVFRTALSLSIFVENFRPSTNFGQLKLQDRSNLNNRALYDRPTNYYILETCV